MFESSILTGKITTSGTGPNTTVVKKLYVKVFPGEFSFRSPSPKKAKRLIGELLIRYSAREWPVKKNGEIIGDPGFLQGLAELLRGFNVQNADELEFGRPSRQVHRDCISVVLGNKLTQEIIDRGWANLDK